MQKIEEKRFLVNHRSSKKSAENIHQINTAQEFLMILKIKGQRSVLKTSAGGRQIAEFFGAAEGGYLQRRMSEKFQQKININN